MSIKTITAILEPGRTHQNNRCQSTSEVRAIVTRVSQIIIPSVTSSSDHLKLWPLRSLALMKLPCLWLLATFGWHLWPIWISGSYERPHCIAVCDPLTASHRRHQRCQQQVDPAGYETKTWSMDPDLIQGRYGVTAGESCVPQHPIRGDAATMERDKTNSGRGGSGSATPVLPTTSDINVILL